LGGVGSDSDKSIAAPIHTSRNRSRVPA
jgi:hypothetical protein